jgi:hypothetical protein
MPGRAPDHTYLTLDLRLFRNASLSTTIGDAGSFVLDLLWRYCYGGLLLQTPLVRQ